MKLIKACTFPLLLLLLLLLISYHVSATETSQDGKKANEEPKQKNLWRRGRVCRYGCCGHWRGNFCGQCCISDESVVVTDDDDDYGYGWGGRGGFGFGWGGHGGWGGGWGGWGGGGGGWGGCRYGCCDHRHGNCYKCCYSAAEAKAYHQNELQP